MSGGDDIPATEAATGLSWARAVQRDMGALERDHAFLKHRFDMRQERLDTRGLVHDLHNHGAFLGEGPVWEIPSAPQYSPARRAGRNR